jgi:DNA-binding response OmpR family regulator
MQKILLVDSDLALRDKLAFILQHSGFQVVSAGRCEQALAEIDESDPDLIVMAENNHIFSEGEGCVRIRELCQAPIIILGQNREEAAGIDLLEMGADVYLTSPLNLRELLARVRSLLRRKQSKKQTLEGIKGDGEDERWL